MSEGAHEPGVALDVILTAEIPTPRNYVFRRGASPAARMIAGLRPTADLIRSPCLAFAIHHPDAGTLLIDTGMHADALRSLRRDFGRPMSLLFRSMRPASKPYDVQLQALGIEPSSVGAVLMTHLRVDHTSGMRLLPGARFTCTRQEWEATRPRLAAGKGYVRHHLPAASRMRLIDLDGHGTRFGPFSRTQDLLGDGSIRLISTPGHTVGHMSVLLQLDDRRRVLIVGDAAYTLRSIERESCPCSPTTTRTHCAPCARSRRSPTASPMRSWCPPMTPRPGTAYARSPRPGAAARRSQGRRTCQAATAL